MITRKHYSDRVKRPWTVIPWSPCLARASVARPRWHGIDSLGHPQYFDLEDPVMTQLIENPVTALR